MNSPGNRSKRPHRAVWERVLRHARTLRDISHFEILEVGGRGGVFHHTLAVAIALADTGRLVRVHTSSDCEITDDRVKFCYCFDWKRDQKFLRRAHIAAHFLLRTLPHIARLRSPIWIQGLFIPPLTLVAIAAMRVARTPVVFSPHTLFARHGGRAHRAALAWCLRLSDWVVSYNDQDEAALERKGVRGLRLPLLMYAPDLRASTVERWRVRLDQSGARVCSVGQLRADKNLPMLMEASRRAAIPLVIVGADTGGGEELRRLLRSDVPYVTEIHEGYLPLEDLAAVAALTGLVALPYSVASQSGVAVLARAYGAKVIAYAAGSLAEQADVVVETLEPSAWAAAIRANARKSLVPGVPSAARLSESEMEQLGAIRDLLLGL